MHPLRRSKRGTRDKFLGVADRAFEPWTRTIGNRPSACVLSGASGHAPRACKHDERNVRCQLARRLDPAAPAQL
jgi:hypothetical protein